MNLARILTLLLTVVLAGCASTPQEPDKKPTETGVAQQAAGVDVTTIVEQRTGYLPADTEFVVVVRADYVWNAAMEFMPMGTTTADLKSFKKTLGETFAPGPGTNFFEARNLIVAKGPTSLTLIFDGEFEVPSGVPVAKVDGLNVYELDELYESKPSLEYEARSADIYLAILDDRPGAAVHVDWNPQEQRKKWPSADDALSSDTRRTLEKLLALTPSAGVVAANLRSGEMQRETIDVLRDLTNQSAFSLPERFVMGLGEKISFGALGGDAEVSGFESNFDEFFASTRRVAEKAGESHTNMPPDARVFGGFFHTFVGAYPRAMEKTETDQSLLYTIPAPRGALSTILFFDDFDGWLRKARRYFVDRSETNAAPTQNVVKVVKAAVDIEEGTVFRESMVKIQEVPPQFLPPNPLMAQDVRIYEGEKFTVDVRMGDIILQSDFAPAVQPEEPDSGK